MNRFFYKGPIQEETITMTDLDDVKHLQRVLRLGIGDSVEICDSLGRVFFSEIIGLEKQSVLLRCVSEDLTARELPIGVDLIQGLPKAAKMDVIIQKNVELGVHSVRGVEFKRSVTRLKEGSGQNKIDRWQKIADEASKQAKRNARTVIEPSLNFKEFLNTLEGYDLILLAYEKAETSLKAVLQKVNPQRIAVIIGPEGGLTEEEVQCMEQYGAKTISLGHRILRTETAGMFVVSTLAYVYEDQGI